MLVERAVPEAAKRPCPAPTLLASGTRKALSEALAKDGTALIACEARRRAAIGEAR